MFASGVCLDSVSMFCICARYLKIVCARVSVSVSVVVCLHMGQCMLQFVCDRVCLCAKFSVLVFSLAEFMCRVSCAVSVSVDVSVYAVPRVSVPVCLFRASSRVYVCSKTCIPVS